MIPQIIIGILFVLGIFGVLLLDNNQRHCGVSSVIANIIFFAALAFGGFFAVWGWPQWIIIGIQLVCLIHAIAHDGESYDYDGSARLVSLLIACIEISCLVMGGFFKSSPKPESTPTITIQVPVNNLTIVRDATSTTYTVRGSIENLQEVEK